MTEESKPDQIHDEDAGLELSQVEIRVLGALMEKQRTTPDYYPMTLKALVQACNQKTSRNPIMNLTEGEVGHTLGLLRDRELVRASFSGRAERYEQRLARLLDVDRQGQALLCVLMLRGPQTLGELRSNAGRMAQFEDLAAVNAALQQLMDRSPPLVRKLPRAAGHREERYLQLLGGDQGSQMPVDLEGPENAGDDGRIASLEQQVGRLRTELDALWELTGLQKPDPDVGSG